MPRQILRTAIGKAGSFHLSILGNIILQSKKMDKNFFKNQLLIYQYQINRNQSRYPYTRYNAHVCMNGNNTIYFHVLPTPSHPTPAECFTLGRK